MTKDALYELLELLSEFNCTYVLDKDDEAVINMAIEVVGRIYEQEG